MIKLQVLIHQHYETIKLALIVLLVIMSFFIILNQLEENYQGSKFRQEGIAEVIRSIETESKNQTDIMNRQFKAICLLILETSPETFSQLDPDTRERCENLSRAEAEADRQATLTPPSSMHQSNIASSSQSTSAPPARQPDNSPPPPPPTEPPDPPQSILPLVDEPVIGCSTVLGVEVCL